MKEVTDPAILAALNGSTEPAAPAVNGAPTASLSPGQIAAGYASSPVRDPALLDLLEGREPESDEPSSVVDDMGLGERFAAAAGRGVVSLGRGAKQALDVPAVWLEEHLGGESLSRSLGLPTAAESAATSTANREEAAQLDKPLLDTTAGKIGNIAGMAAALAPTALIPGAATIAGASTIGAGTGLLGTEGDLAERVQSGVAGAAGGAIGTLAGRGIGAAAGRIGQIFRDRSTAAAAANSVRDGTQAAGRELGFVLPPAQANPTVINRILEGFAGKLTTGQAASEANQGVFNRIAREAIGLAPDAPLTPQALAGVRRQAGQAYQALDAIPITADAGYRQALQNIASRQSQANTAFPGIANDEVQTLIQSLDQSQFSGQQATSAISLLREEGRAAFASGDAGLARAYNQASEALEDVVDRNLQAAGNPELLGQYRDARRLIATTHSVERALNEGSGNVVGTKLGQQVARGRPLAGDLRDAGRFAQAFPNAAKEPTSSLPMLSPLDFAVGGFSSAVAGNPALMGAIAGRPLVRAALLSRPYQALMTTPSRDPSALGQLMLRALEDGSEESLRRGSTAYAVQQQ